MKKIFILSVLLAILLAACGGIKTDVPENSEAKATQAIVEEFILANVTYDADRLIGLYSEDLVWIDYGLNDGPLSKGNLAYFIRESAGDWGYTLKVRSYLVTPDARFAVLQADISMQANLTGKWSTVPSVVVLEIKDGLIVNETWYYDGSVFH